MINHPTAKLGDLEKTGSYNHESEWNDDATLYPEVREDIGPR